MMDSQATRRIDIHQPEEINLQIKRAKNELEEMIDLNPQVIMLLDRHGRIVRANKATLEFFSITDFTDILYKDLRMLFHNIDKSAVADLLDHNKGYRSIEANHEVSGRGSRKIRLSIVSSGQSGDFEVLIVNDISAESRNAKDLEKRHKKEAVEALTGALMHKINQPLTVIMMRAQMVKIAIQQNRIDPAEVRRSLDDIMKLSMSVADTLQTVDKPRDFVTEPYVRGLDILDLKKSGTRNASIELTCSTMLDVLLVTLDTRIPGTILHARCCGALANAIGEKGGIDTRTCEIARQAGFVHDIGKLAIPELILRKPSSLSSEETAIMRTHSEIGYQIVRSLIFMEDEAEAVRSHHEFFNGTGYPRGLSGKDIPLSACILSAADAFEVMISGRPYKKPSTLTETVEQFRNMSGIQFNPDIADIVINNAVELHQLLKSME